MNFLHIGLCVFLLTLGVNLYAHADTHPNVSGVVQHTAHSSCQAWEKAEDEARELAIQSARAYCRGEGFGWKAAVIKDIGKLDCQRCDGGRLKCRYAKVALDCRKKEQNLSLFGWFFAKE